MLPGELWRALELEPDEVARRAGFFQAYLRARDEFPAPSQASEAVGRRHGESGLSAVGEPPGLSDGDLRIDAGEGRGSGERGWFSEAEEADTLREAAIAMLLVDAERGQAMLGEAASRYESLSVPYSLFLRALGESRESGDQLALRAGGELGSATGGRGDSEMTEAPPAAAQMVHLMLVLGSSPAASREFRSLPGRLAEHPALRSGVGFGRTGAVIADWWRVALSVLGVEDGEDRRGTLRGHFSRIAARHGEQLERAQMDSFHWRQLQSPVDLVDLDLAGALCLANRRLRTTEDPLESDDFAELSPLARISLAVGFEMGMDAGSGAPEPVEA